jgi:FixJ family two-component response regulator
MVGKTSVLLGSFDRERGVQLRALVVDDEPLVRRIIMRVLLGFGFLVTGACDGREGLERRPEEFDVIFTDLTMPNLNGKEFKRELDARHVRVPVVVVSGEPDIAAAAEEMHAAAWIAKPFSRSGVGQAIAAALSNGYLPLSAAE